MHSGVGDTLARVSFKFGLPQAGGCAECGEVVWRILYSRVPFSNEIAQTFFSRAAEKGCCGRLNSSTRKVHSNVDFNTESTGALS